ncbi:RnfABCDGE type electron transport complex subunit D [uncultured Sulfitobacter sp.]|uniref:RnfABCDGE type electron transport complex subunit D n=1 Tax=uncultured Sulfitobacter sp. TaxID=191468 RepID=UPI00260888F4|nr:RnfABCDGE type electron transport complex subunit D [uncultured Sulfitobacter sp.]
MTPPLVHFRWTPANVSVTQTAAMLPVLIAVWAAHGPAVLATLGVAVVAALAWEGVFALIRQRPVTAHGLTTALIIAIMAPVSLPLWQIAVAVSLGVVLGELIFGGRGFGFLNAGVAALAFLVFSFPGVALLQANFWVAAATVPGAVLLLAVGLAPWRPFVVAILSVAAVKLLSGEAITLTDTGAALLFGLVFLACDPVGGAATRAGQWLYGALVGGLIGLFAADTGPAITANAVVFAVLLASIFAPLLDYLVVEVNVRRRRNRAGRAHV